MNIHKPFYDRYKCGKWPKEHSFHTFKFDDEIIQGDDDTPFRFEQSCKVFDWNKLNGKSVIDIGAWSGWFSFQAEKYGASKILATDWFCSDNGPGPGTNYIFNYVKEKLKSKVEYLEIDVPDITRESVGQFDMVMALGLFYHLPSILTSIVNLCEVARETILIESAIDLQIPQDYACTRLYMFNDYCNDPSNWFIPNPQFYRDVLRYCGFSCQESLYKIGSYDRGVFCGIRL